MNIGYNNSNNQQSLCKKKAGTQLPLVLLRSLIHMKRSFHAPESPG